MAITKAHKAEILDRLNVGLKNAQSVVFVHFKGLNVADTTLLRRALRGADIRYTVAKKTLVKRALANLTVAGDQPTLDNEIAIAYGTDLLAPAREIHTFAKGHKDQMNIVGGIFGGVYKNAEEMLAIATIPPRETLIAQFVNLINSPIQGLVIGLDAIATKKETPAA